MGPLFSSSPMKRFTRILLSVVTLICLLPTATQAYYFPDVPESNSRSIAIDFLYVLGFVEGNPDGTFAPTRLLNRAEFAKLAVLITGEEDLQTPSAPCFKDVPVSAWFASYVCKAKELGIMKGDGGAGITFSPERTLNTAETLAVMDRLFDWQSPENQGEWYDSYLAGAKLRNVSDAQLRAEAPMQRQQFAEIMARSIVVFDADAPSFTSDVMYDDFFNYEVTPEDCVEGEIYNGETQTCDLDCSIEGICDEAAEAIDELAEQIEGSKDEFQEGDANNILASYEIINEMLSPQAKADEEAVWDLFKKLIPTEQRKDFNEFKLFSDGESNLLAAVVLSDKEPKKWVLNVDMADTMNADELTETLIHEFAHVLTLRTGQLRFDSDMTFPDGLNNGEMLEMAEAKCNLYYTGEGCTLESSYLWKFYTKFWKDILGEHPAGGSSVHLANDEEIAAYYEGHQDNFVTEYAATSPAEDIAETFVFFVVKDKPTGRTIKDQKISFFWDYPELLSLRTFIRNKLR